MKRIMSAFALAILIGSTVVALHNVDQSDTVTSTEATAHTTHQHKQ